MFGAVVVGVGTAGSVRIRDMLAPLAGSPAEKLAVKGFVSRYKHVIYLCNLICIAINNYPLCTQSIYYLQQTLAGPTLVG